MAPAFHRFTCCLIGFEIPKDRHVGQANEEFTGRVADCDPVTAGQGVRPFGRSGFSGRNLRRGNKQQCERSLERAMAPRLSARFDVGTRCHGTLPVASL